MIVVLTKGDEFQGAMEEEGGFTNIEEWCCQQEGRFQKLYQDCGGRVVLINNKEMNENKRKQTQKILNLVVELNVCRGSRPVHKPGKMNSDATEENLKGSSRKANTQHKRSKYTQKRNVNFRGSALRKFAVTSHKMSTRFKMTIAWLIFVTECCQSIPAFRHLCHPGTYVYTTRNNKNICQSCPHGTFMPYSLHTHKTCYSCTQIRDQNLEVLKTECSRTRDAEILCTPGYYRRKARNVREGDRCERCYECEHPTLPCQDYHDTVCCGHTNYVAVLNKDGVYECKEKPILCDPGQFLNSETEECTPCPPGTFMSEVQHNKTTCRTCSTVSDQGAHETILQACTSTQQAILGCEDGYFRNSSGNLSDKMQCLPCQKCEYQGRKCDMYHDTVCGDYPDMIVVNTSSGYQCRHNPTTISSSQTGSNKEEQNETVCGENKYVYFSHCLPCGSGTYIDMINHTERVCKNCSQIQGSQAPRGCEVLIHYIQDAETKQMFYVLTSAAIFTFITLIIAGRCYFNKKSRRHQKIRGKDDKKINENSKEVVKLLKCRTQSEDIDVNGSVLRRFSV